MPTISSTLTLEQLLSSDSVSTIRLKINEDFNLLYTGLISVIDTLGIDAGPNINVNSVQATDIVANTFSTKLPYQPGGVFGTPYNFHVDSNGFLSAQSVFSNTHVETTRLWLDPDPTVQAHAAGELRWSGTDFLGWTGSRWVSFTSANFAAGTVNLLFNTAVSAFPGSDPGNGHVAFNTSTYQAGPVGYLYISNVDTNNNSTVAFIEGLNGGILRLSNFSNPSQFVDVSIMGMPINETTYYAIPIMWSTGSGTTFTLGESMVITYAITAITGAENIPTSGNQLYSPFSVVFGDTLEFNQMVAGTNVSFTSGMNGSTIINVSTVSGYSGYSGKSGYSGVSGYSGKSGYSGVSGKSGSGVSGYSGAIGASGYSGKSGYSGYSGKSGVGASGYSGKSGASGSIGVSGFSGHSGNSGTSGTSGKVGVPGPPGASGFSGYSGAGASGTSGFSGISGSNGTAGASGFSGKSGYSGASGTFGGAIVNASSYNPVNPAGTNSSSLVMMGLGGTILFTPLNTGILKLTITGNQTTTLGSTTMKIYYGTGSAPANGAAVTGTQTGSIMITNTTNTDTTPSDPWSGSALVGTLSVPLVVGTTYWFDIAMLTNSGNVVSINDVVANIEELSGGYSGYTGFSGTSGASGTSGYSGYTGYSGASGYSGISGYSGYTGVSGTSGVSGYSGANPGASGFSGTSGYTGVSGFSGENPGASGWSGLSGYSGQNPGASGFSGFSGNSGYSGANPGASGFSGYSGSTVVGNAAFGELYMQGNGTATDIATAGTYVQITAGWSVGDANGTTPDAVGANITTNTSSEFIVDATGTISAASGDNAGSIAIFKNGTIIPSSVMTISFQFGALVNAQFSSLNLVSLTSGDIIDLRTTSTNNPSVSVTFSDINFRIAAIAGTAGSSGFSGYSGQNPGASGFSGYSGQNPGASGFSGYSGYSGTSGFTGVSGYSGQNPGASGFSGYSGFSGANSPYGYASAVDSPPGEPTSIVPILPNDNTINIIYAGAFYSAITCGVNNSINAPYSAIAGGVSNFFSEGSYNFIGGGGTNGIAGNNCAILGGSGNQISGGINYSSIIAGFNNRLSANNSSIVGGGNIISSLQSAAISENFAVAQSTIGSYSAGLATLGAGGSVTVSTTQVTSHCMIFVTSQDINTTGIVRVINQNVGSGFEIVSSVGTDSGVIAWMIIQLT